MLYYFLKLIHISR